MAQSMKRMMSEAEKYMPKPMASYSPKMASAGMDMGMPGKNFVKIAKKAGARYGSAAAGKRVAGAVLRGLRGGKGPKTKRPQMKYL